MTSVLDGFPLLSDMTSEERSALEACLEARELDMGSVLFRSGEETDALYFVVDGAISIRADGQNVSELGAGEVLGALSLVCVGRRECDASGATPVKLLSLTRESYVRLREDLPALTLRLQEAILRSFSMLVRGVIGDSRSPSSSSVS
ncbi:MAG TPA: cyclic nucleotide-binding domain-containing protein [Myxococcota bacterium]|nr:cyclic nucleotide-binding domain-containing protein [Myxococcota bacterium]